MGRTARRVLGAGSIAALLALTALEGVAAPAETDAISRSPLPLPGSPGRSVETTVPRAAEERGSMRAFAELLILAVTCAAVVAFYSVTAGERGGTRVPARVRRR